MRDADEVEMLDEPQIFLRDPLDLRDPAVFLLEPETLWLGATTTFGPTRKGVELHMAPSPEWEQESKSRLPFFRSRKTTTPSLTPNFLESTPLPTLKESDLITHSTSILGVEIVDFGSRSEKSRASAR